MIMDNLVISHNALERPVRGARGRSAGVNSGDGPAMT